MRWLSRFTLVLLLFCCGACPALAQLNEHEPAHVHFHENAGLDAKIVFDVMCDSKGRMWLGTGKGPARIKDRQVEFLSPIIPPAYEKQATVYYVTEDEKGRIWFGDARNQIFYFEDNRFHPYEHQEVLFENQPSGKYFNGLRVSNDTVYMAFRVRTLKMITPDGQWSEVFEDSTKTDALVVDVCILPNGNIAGLSSTTKRLFRDGADSLLFRIKRRNGKVSSVRFSQKIRQFKGSEAFALVKGDSLLVALDKHLFILVNDEVVEHLELDFVIRGIGIDPLQRLLVSSADGLWVYDLKTLTPLFKWFEGNYIVLKEPITDYENGTWLASLNKGIYYIPDMRITHYSAEYIDMREWGSSITSDDEGTIHVDMVLDKLLCIDASGDTSHHSYPVPPEEPIVHPFVHSSSEHDLLFFARQNIVTVIDNETKKVVEDLPFPVCRVIRSGADGSVWGANTIRIALLHPAFVEVEKFETQLRINDLAPESSDKVWLATMEGFFCYESQSGWRKVELPESSEGEAITNVSLLADGHLFVATRYETFIYDPSATSDAWRQPEELSGCCFAKALNDSLITLHDPSGISIATMQNGEIKVSKVRPPLAVPNSHSYECTWANDALWVTIKNGFVRYDASLFQPSEEPESRILIEEIKVNDSTVSLLPEYELHHSEDRLWFRFQGLSQKQRNKKVYRYRLKGLEEEWTETQNTEIQYTSLPPGNYQFEVEVENADRSWSAHTQAASFTILPAFWETWWFRTLMLLSFGGILYLLMRWWIQRIQTANELQSQALRFQQNSLAAQINPHFIYNAMNSIQGFVLRNEQESAYHYLQGFGSLIRHVLNQSGQEIITLEEEIDTLKKYLELESMRQPGLFTFHFEVASDLDPNFVELPPMLIQPHVENAIWHGFNGIQYPGELRLSFTETDDVLKCSIKDNGIGRKAAASRKSNGSPKSKGTGNVSERLKLLSSLYHSKFQILTEDLTNGENLACGTSVTLTIPLIRKK